MGQWTYLILLLLLMDILTFTNFVECRGGGGGSRSSSSGSRSSSSGSRSSSSGSRSSSSGSRTSSSGSKSSSSAWKLNSKTGISSSHSNTLHSSISHSNTLHSGTSHSDGSQSTGGWHNPYGPGIAPPVYNSPQPYKIYKPDGTFSHISTNNPGSIKIPPYSPDSPSANTPKKGIINNHYYIPRTAYSSSQHGMNYSYYPTQNNFGYPGGHYGNNQASYGGMGLFSSGGGGYGYPGGGNWGGYPSYGSSSGSGSTTKGILIGAAGGYLANSLVNRPSNPWNYQGHGYGYNYNRYEYNRNPPPPTQAPTSDPTKDWMNCIAFNPATKETLINPNCTCTVTVVTDPITGQNASHHDCTPFAQEKTPPLIPQQQFPAYVVNKPPPTINGNSYGESPPQNGTNSTEATVAPPTEQGTVISPVTSSERVVVSSVIQKIAARPVSRGESSVTLSTLTPKPELLVGDSISHKRMEVYSQLEKLLNMGRFTR